MLGGSLLGQKKYAEAEPLLLSGYEGVKQREDKIISGNSSPRFWRFPADEQTMAEGSPLRRLVQLYEATGGPNPTQAAQWSRRDTQSADRDSVARVRLVPDQ
jgi:hypothetical protein